MLRKFLPLAIAAGVAALVVGSVSLASGSSSARVQTAKDSPDLVFLDITVHTATVDVDNSHSFTPGDEFIFNSVLKNPDGTKTLGTVQGYCVATDLSQSPNTAHCVTTATFAGGTIEGDGLSSQQGSFKLAVTGGTGQFDQARGEITIQPLSADRSIDTLDID